MHWVKTGIHQVDVRPIIEITGDLVGWFGHGARESGAGFEAGSAVQWRGFGGDGDEYSSEGTAILIRVLEKALAV